MSRETMSARFKIALAGCALVIIGVWGVCGPLGSDLERSIEVVEIGTQDAPVAGHWRAVEAVAAMAGR